MSEQISVSLMKYLLATSIWYRQLSSKKTHKMAGWDFKIINYFYIKSK